MLSLLARGRTLTERATRRMLRAPATAAEESRRLVALGLGGLVITSGAAFGTLALTTERSGPERGFGGYSDVRTVRDLQLPTL